MDIECESWQDKGLEQIDRPVIRFAKKIHKDSLDVGKGCLVSSNVSDDTKRKLIETDRKINTGYKPYYSVLLVIAVAVSLAVMVTCIFVSSDFISGLQISMIIELVIWCPGIFIFSIATGSRWQCRMERHVCTDFRYRISGFMFI